MKALKFLERLALAAGMAGVTVLFAGPVAYAGHGGVDHTTFQSRPSYLGVSGGGDHFLDINGQLYCYAGTLGSLVVDSHGTQYVLSNNHVLANESFDGISPPSQLYALQPGLLDLTGTNSCPSSTDPTSYAQYRVGLLSSFVFLSSTSDNEVDAAIAAVSNNCDATGYSASASGPCIDPNGRILEIGGLSGNTQTAYVGMAVQKSGRTTGLTTGTVGAIDVSVTVSYDNGTANFVNQILVSGSKGAFIKAGDSGSLLVTQGSLPDAVGLLFAGSQNGVAIANPIDTVLTDLGVTMVACKSGCSATVPGGSGGGTTSGGGGGGGNNGHHGPKSAVGGLSTAAAVLDRHRHDLMANPDVVGTGLSVDQDGTPVIQVYTKGAVRSVDHPIPSQLDGIKVQVIVTGAFKAL